MLTLVGSSACRDAGLQPADAVAPPPNAAFRFEPRSDRLPTPCSDPASVTPSGVPSPMAVRVRGSGDGPAPKRLSYVTNQSAEDRCRDGCEWRVYDPGTGVDDLFLKLPHPFYVLFWDPSLRHVYFEMKGAVYRVDWRRGATPEPVLTTPDSEESQSFPWLDAESGRWRYFDYADPKPGQEGDEAKTIVRVFEQSPDGSSWTLVTTLKTDCGCEPCPCTSVADPYMHKDAAKLPASRDVWDKELGAEIEGEEEQHDRTVYVPSRAEAHKALRLVSYFDGEGSFEEPPVYYVNRETGTESLVLEKTELEGPYADGCVGNLEFSEQGRYMLMQRLGRCLRLIDMRTGEVLFSRPPITGQAFWVDPPQP